MSNLLFIIIWYLSGLLASHVIITLGPSFTWGNSWGVGILTAIFGPFNFFGILGIID